jgi:hypothetical protein
MMLALRHQLAERTPSGREPQEAKLVSVIAHARHADLHRLLAYDAQSGF